MPLIGQTLMASFIEPPNYTGPWMRRIADAASFGMHIIDISPGTNLSVMVQHKNSEDPDSAATTATSMSRTSTGVEVSRATGLKELVRYRYSPGHSEDEGWVHFAMTPEVWEQN